MASAQSELIPGLILYPLMRGKARLPADSSR